MDVGSLAADTCWPRSIARDLPRSTSPTAIIDVRPRGEIWTLKITNPVKVLRLGFLTLTDFIAVVIAYSKVVAQFLIADMLRDELSKRSDQVVSMSS